VLANVANVTAIVVPPCEAIAELTIAMALFTEATLDEVVEEAELALDTAVETALVSAALTVIVPLLIPDVTVSTLVIKELIVAEIVVMSAEFSLVIAVIRLVRAVVKVSIMFTAEMDDDVVEVVTTDRFFRPEDDTAACTLDNEL